MTVKERDELERAMPNYYRGKPTHLAEHWATRLSHLICVLALAVFVVNLVTCITENLGYVDYWVDENGERGTLTLGMYMICVKDWKDATGSPLPGKQANKCYPYQSKDGYSLITNHAGYHGYNDTDVGDSECDDKLNFFSKNADDEDTQFCHVRNATAVFATIGTVINFVTLLISIYISNNHHRETEWAAFGLYIGTTLCFVIAYGSWTSFLDKWGDAAWGGGPTSVVIHRGVSLDCLLFSWVLSFALVFLCLAKLHLVRHDGDFHEDDLKLKQAKFVSERHRDQEMYDDLLWVKGEQERMLLELEELVIESRPAGHTPENSDDDEDTDSDESDSDDDAQPVARFPGAGTMMPMGMMMTPQMQQQQMLMLQQQQMMGGMGGGHMMGGGMGMGMGMGMQPMMGGHPGMMTPGMQQGGMQQQNINMNNQGGYMNSNA